MVSAPRHINNGPIVDWVGSAAFSSADAMRATAVVTDSIAVLEFPSAGQRA